VLPCLSFLDISGNGARVITPELGLAPQLSTLLAAHNAFNDLNDVLCSSRSLKVVDVSHNRLRRISNRMGTMMTSLETLDVSCNYLMRLPDSLGRCPSLRNLLAHSNRLLNVPTTMGPIMAALTAFDVSNNPMVRVVSKRVAEEGRGGGGRVEL
jgi:Leucine-rich repeat (LRR) protein